MSAATVTMRRWAVLLLALALLAGQVGCGGRAAHPAYLSEEERHQVGVIGLVAVNFPPGSDLVRPAAGPGEGIGRGMAKGAAIGAGVVLQGGSGCADGFCALAALAVAAGAAVVGAVIGAVVGGAKALDRKEVQEAEARIRKAIGEMSSEDYVRESLLSEARKRTSLVFVSLDFPGPSSPEERPDYRPLLDEGIDTVLEAGIVDCGLAGNVFEIDPPVTPTVSARVRLVRARDNSPVYEETFRFSGQQKTFLEWAEDDGRAFCDEIRDLCGRLAVAIVEALFLVSVPGESASDRETMASLALKIVEPELGAYVMPPRVESLRPTLKWESFPRPEEVTRERQELVAGAQEVSYEVRIWSLPEPETAHRRAPMKLVYHREALPLPEHTLEEALDPSTYYLLSVRAWYTVRGQRRTTIERPLYFRTPER